MQEEEKKERDDDVNALFQEERDREKRDAKREKKQVERALQKKVDSSHHVNLFQAEEIAAHMKQRQRDEEKNDVHRESKVGRVTVGGQV